MSYVIQVKEACKKIKNQEILKSVNLSCAKGEICGIVGHNGSGKTVLFKCICGLLNLDGGEIIINNKVMHRDINILSDAGVIIEEPSFLPNYSGYKNLEYLYSVNNKVDREHLKDVLIKVGLDCDSKKKVKNYSMGMKQRLAIAQAIMESQEILILDEPMNGLDRNGVKYMRELFLELKEKGVTILMASHNKEDIDVLCDHVYEMEEGILSKVR